MRMLLAEGAVVILSILIAFALDAAWDGRELQREVDQDLASIIVEVQDNIVAAENHVALAQRIADALGEGLTRLRAAPTSPTVSLADTIVWWQAMTPTFEPALGAIDAIVASGRMSAIGDRDLTRRLAGLRSRIDDAVEEEFEAQSYFEAIHAPRVFADLDFSELYYLSEEFASTGTNQALETRQSLEHPNSVEIRSALEYRRYLYLEAVSSLDGIVNELRSIESVLESRSQHGSRSSPGR